MRKSNFKQSLIPLSIIASLGLSNHLNAMGSDYLDAVKADYDEFSSGTFEPPPGSTWSASSSEENNTPSLSYERLEDFSLFLKDESPGSFIFYDVLPAEYKDQLHQQYLRTGNLDEIKKDIFRYSNEIKQQSLK